MNILTERELPLVSILITSYNRANFIEEAIKSALNQTYKRIEIIIVDNCSTDYTREILNKYEPNSTISIYFNETNIGQFPNRNKAASLANGKYLKYLDSDDLLYPYSVEIMVMAMEKFPESGIGISYEVFQNHLPFPFELKPDEALNLHFEKGLLFPGPGSIIYKSNIFEEFEGFEDYGLPSDNLLSLKIASRYKVVALPRDLYWWRRHEEQEYNNMAGNPVVQIQSFLMNKKILESPDCPISFANKRYFLLCHRKRISTKIIKYMLKAEFKKSLYILLYSKISFRDIALAFIPVKYFK